MHLQRTFDNELVAPAPDPDAMVLCSDDTHCRYADVYFDSRGNPHSNHDDCMDADQDIVNEILDMVDEHVCGYAQHEDYGEMFVCCALEGFYSPSTNAFTKMLYDAINGYDCEVEYNSNEYTSYDGDGLCLGSFPVGEYEEQVDISQFPELQVLLDRDDLLELLENARSDSCVESNPRLQDDYPCFHTYHLPGGIWHVVVPRERVIELTTETVLEYCRRYDKTNPKNETTRNRD